MCTVSVTDMQHFSVCQDVEGQSFRKAELELALLCSFNSLRSSQKSYTRGGNMNDGNMEIVWDRFCPSCIVFIPQWTPVDVISLCCYILSVNVFKQKRRNPHSG